MGAKYTTQSTSGYNSSPPSDDGAQVASNLVTWAGVKTKLADVLKTFGEAINTALVSALDLSARAISTPDTAVASDHWKTLQVTGTTAITLSSAASMGAGYEVGIFNAGTGVVTVTPGLASDTINGVSASVTVSIKGTKIFRTNQALTGYNIVGGYDPQTVTAMTSVVTPLIGTMTAVDLNLQVNSAIRWLISDSGGGALLPSGDNSINLGSASKRVAAVFVPIIDTGTTGSGALKTNNGTTVLTWDNNGAIAIGGRASPASGVGVAFPAAQSASTDVNTLDDYEEGTWTPSVGGTATYTLQQGTYTKIGRLVFFTAEITINAIGSGSTTTISGLPFAAAATYTHSVQVSNTAQCATNVVSISGSIAAGASAIILGSRTAAAASDGSNAIFQNTTVVKVSGCYQA